MDIVHRTSRTPAAAGLLLALTLLWCAACASLGVRTEGTSGPLAWRTTDLYVVKRQVEGREADTYAFVLHVKNVTDQTITLTHMERTVHQAGGGHAGYGGSSGTWELKPNAERRFPLSSHTYCRDVLGCQDRGISAPLWKIVFTGKDTQDRPVRVPIDIALPAQVARYVDLAAGGGKARPPDPPPARSSGATSVGPPGALADGAITAPIWKPGFEWEFRWESPAARGTFVWAVEGIDTVEGTDHYVITSGGRRIYYRASDGALSMETVPDGIDRKFNPPNAIPWPLTIGQAWTWTYTLERPLRGATSEEVRQCTAEAEERVTVPAGTFAVLKITCRDPRTQKVTQELWYSPEVRQRVRDRFPVTDGHEERELVRYKLD